MEARTRGKPALHFDGPAVFAHDAISDRKSQSSTLAGALGREERIVNPLQVLRGDTLPIVTYIDASKPIGVPGLNRQPGWIAGRPAALHRIAGIQKEVEENLLQLARISLHARQAVLEIE